MRAAVLAILAGCWSNAPAPAVTPRSPAVEVAAKPGDTDAAYRQAIDDPLGFLPANANFVLGIEVGALRDSAIWQHYAAQVERLVKLDTLVDPTCRALYDTLESFTFGLDVRDPDTAAGVMVLRGLDFTGMKTCLSHSPDTTVRTLAGNRRLATESAKSGGVTSRAIMQWVDARTCVAVVGKTVTEADLDRALANPAAARRQSELATVADGVIGSGAHAVWGAFSPSGPVATQMTMLGISNVEVVFGSVDTTDEVVINAHARMPTAQDATDLTQKFAGNLSSLKMFLARIDLVAADRDAVLDVRATQGNIDGLISLLGGGALGGGGSTTPPPPSPTP